MDILLFKWTKLLSHFKHFKKIYPTFLGRNKYIIIINFSENTFGQFFKIFSVKFHILQLIRNIFHILWKYSSYFKTITEKNGDQKNRIEY